MTPPTRPPPELDRPAGRRRFHGPPRPADPPHRTPLERPGPLLGAGLLLGLVAGVAAFTRGLVGLPAAGGGAGLPLLWLLAVVCDQAASRAARADANAGRLPAGVYAADLAALVAAAAALALAVALLARGLPTAQTHGVRLAVVVALLIVGWLGGQLWGRARLDPARRAPPAAATTLARVFSEGARSAPEGVARPPASKTPAPARPVGVALVLVGCVLPAVPAAPAAWFLGLCASLGIGYLAEARLRTLAACGEPAPPVLPHDAARLACAAAAVLVPVEAGAGGGLRLEPTFWGLLIAGDLALDLWLRRR